MRLRTIFIITLLSVLYSCVRKNGDYNYVDIQESISKCDLVFVGKNNDANQKSQSSMSDAIILSTSDSLNFNFFHVAVVDLVGDSVFVIEASDEYGVCRRSLSAFLTDYRKDSSHVFFVVKRLHDTSHCDLYLSNLHSLLGCGYDSVFLPSNGKYYCSELVRDTYVNQLGDTLFDDQPMNFLSPDGSMPEFWLSYFSRLKVPVPQGLRGTNPSDLSRSTLLYTVDVNLWTYLNTNTL